MSTPTLPGAVAANALVDLAAVRRLIAPTQSAFRSDQDDVLQFLLNAASDWMEHACRRVLRSRAFMSVPYSGSGKRELWLQWPITQLTSVVLDTEVQTLWKPGDATDPMQSDVIVMSDPKTGYWTHLYRQGIWRKDVANILVSYHGGYGDADGVNGAALAPVPADLQEAVIILVRDRYYLADKQQQGIVSRTIQGETVTFDQAPIPPRVLEIIDRYRDEAESFVGVGGTVPGGLFNVLGTGMW